MIRIREISDPDLKAKVVRAVAEWRGLSPAAVPEWFELDDADFVDILNAIRGQEAARSDDLDLHDPRM
jgi:hypothetical protein